MEQQNRNIMITVMTENDINQYCELFQRVFARPPWNETWAPEDIRRPLNKIMMKKGFAGVAARLGNDSAGYLTGYKIWAMPDIFYIDQLFVDERLHGSGIGRALLSDIIIKLKKGGYRAAVLLTKPDSPADKFYLRAGFRHILSAIRLRGKVIHYLSLK